MPYFKMVVATKQRGTYPPKSPSVIPDRLWTTRRTKSRLRNPIQWSLMSSRYMDPVHEGELVDK